MCTVLPSTNHSAWQPREAGPAASNRAIGRGRSGSETSNSSKPAGFAPGSPTPDQREAFTEAAQSGVVVVQCSRAASGRVAPRRHLREAGLVAGEDFSPQKARILLMLMLTTTSDIAEIQQAFQTY